MSRSALLCCVALPCCLALGGGCDLDPYYLVDRGDGSIVPPGQETGTVCVPTVDGKEICDRLDNDCDGLVDEDFNFQTNPAHCGGCDHSCQLPGVLSSCELGKCLSQGCAPGFHDLDGDAKNGCEYPCTATGAEICDGRDNDCNGVIDELFNLDNDVYNCGSCGFICSFTHGVPRCDQGGCHLLRCDAGFVDLDNSEVNGCEWPCTRTNGGLEICDGLDNDCNGVIDDPGGQAIDFETDINHCGGCNIACLVPNGQTRCQAGQCQFIGCQSGFVDVDQDLDNGCECAYGGNELCDGLDNDCNGLVDDAMPQYPGVCGLATPPCQQGVVTCEAGIEICRGSLGPWPEFCDGADQDCDGQPDPVGCLTPAGGREVRLDEPQLAELGAANSTQLQIASSGDNILAVWLDRRNEQGDIYGSLSADGGRSWSRPSDLPVATEENPKLEPHVALGGPGGNGPRAYVVYTRFSGESSSFSVDGPRYVYLRRSLDRGQTWSAPLLVSNHLPLPPFDPDTNPAPAEDALYLRLAVVPGQNASEPDQVVVCWEEMHLQGEIAPDVRCSLSTDSGISFPHDPVQANLVPGNANVPQIAIDASYLYVTWQEGTVDPAIHATRAALGGSGLVFEQETILSSGAGKLPQIAADGDGGVVVVWEDIRGSLVDIRANHSLDHGLSWQQQDARVDTDAPLVNGNSTNPQVVARPGGRFVAVWEDTNRGTQNIYANTFDPQAGQWGGSARRVNASDAGAVTSLRPAITFDRQSERIYVAWEDYRAGGLFRDIYFNFSLDGGQVWNRPDYRIDESLPAGAANAQLPLIQATSSGAAILWLDYRRAAGGGLTTGPNGDIYASWVD